MENNDEKLKEIIELLRKIINAKKLINSDLIVIDS